MARKNRNYKSLAEKLLAQRTALRKEIQEKKARLEELNKEAVALRRLLNAKNATPSGLATVPLEARRRGFGRKSDMMTG